MQKMRLLVVFSFFLFHYYSFSQQENVFKPIFPFTSFKKVVDTGMRCYTDLLILEEQLMAHENCDELIDIIVGRLIRLTTYIDQILYDFKYEATILPEEIEYLIRLINYMEITAENIRHEGIPAALNIICEQLKNKLKNGLNPN
jgi:hypothetical protein